MLKIRIITIMFIKCSICCHKLKNMIPLYIHVCICVFTCEGVYMCTGVHVLHAHAHGVGACMVCVDL